MLYTFLLASLQDYLLGNDMVDLCNFHSTLCTTIFVILTNVLSTKFSNYDWGKLYSDSTLIKWLHIVSADMLISAIIRYFNPLNPNISDSDFSKGLVGTFGCISGNLSCSAWYLLHMLQSFINYLISFVILGQNTDALVRSRHLNWPWCFVLLMYSCH